ncbi:hypothetical protein E3T26_01070 [Cryobacterium sp. TMT1-21]|uniref:Uncharacterized protein n=1 Tax=Cryobacterium shii TaxID=1259235 RepID=A0AAQ2C553_9MICO|nr:MULTISPECIES: hypothetical protein [Cryobacterium]TFC44363.1 hypothetical protein E3O49_12005 [Cryobacterium shii]TFC88433.1 hypothetical protein E3T24_02885 [Cryobacterium sp. TmT2-59]TFD17913.1 hypothetical protein E3T26_01070 [Cryobacterium sp. TMT1-21]TFD18908.1 hypothetical protein E3T32_10975 [Cryobacterium sp. TMT2-23]TFD20940.1 hypothetical protein E3T42_01235 [Cryobacterium sp. TMT4-10]
MSRHYRNISVVQASQGATAKTEFQQRLAAYASCDSVQEIRVYAGRRAGSGTVVAQLPNVVDSPQSFSVSQLSDTEPRADKVWVGGSKGGIDVIYTQDVSGDSAPTLDAAAAAAEGAAVVNAVLAKIP